MPRQIVHPRMLAKLANFYPSKLTIQTSTETRSASGAVTITWADVVNMRNLPCSIAPIIRESPFGQNERRQEGVTYVEGTHQLAIRGHYPQIDTTMRAVVDGQPYDIRAVEHDSHAQTTRLRLFVVSV